ncbi:MAG: hypothetical protein PHH21_03720, partial [Candidatus Pacebacteria bacterium]|nr:hypothetical protein [Candidatus Paceibacterota bacterium]
TGGIMCFDSVFARFQTGNKKTKIGKRRLSIYFKLIFGQLYKKRKLSRRKEFACFFCMKE